MQHPEAAVAAAEPASSYVELSGLRLHYLDWGGAEHKRTFVLCHGGSAHAHWWTLVAPQLKSHGRVIALDFRGHGRSQWAEIYGPAAHIADVTKLIRDHLRRSVVLIGHSMGGEIAQRIAVDNPQLVSALIVVDAPYGGPPLRTRLMWRWKRRKQDGLRPEFRTLEELVRRFRLSPPGHNLSPEALAALALKGAERLPNGNWAFRFDPRTRKLTPGWRRHIRCRIQDLRMPVLILRGEHSALASARRIRRMHRRIRGSVLRQIPRAYHHVPLDNPYDTAAAIIEFVESRGG
jgi:pimeloyl-ACP methyl ester carboxylesterase